MGIIAIIGGTGFYDPALLDNAKEEKVTTPYGEVMVLQGTHQGNTVIFLNRHGKGHSVPPHLVNYRANIKALQLLGVKQIIATAAVGSLHFEFKPGMFILADQFLDFTKVRQQTFYEGGAQGVVHCDMTVPYCKDLRLAIETCAKTKEYDLVNGGTYVCTEGPRFETAAEIQMFKQLGGHVIGMTSVPEVCLARELGICYSNISVVTNFAAGISPTILTHSEVVEVMSASISRLRLLVVDSIAAIQDERDCDCRKILSETGVGQ